MSEKETILKELSQTWSMPSKLTPIVIVGAGGIVNDAHLPAYKKVGFGGLEVETNAFTPLIRIQRASRALSPPSHSSVSVQCISLARQSGISAHPSSVGRKERLGER